MYTDFVKDGQLWLIQQLLEHDSEPAQYLPMGDESKAVDVRVVPRRTRLNSVSKEKVVVAAGECDFVMANADYPAEPQVGDIILYDGQRFEVSTCYDWHSVGTAHWKWCDARFIAKRIHTKIAVGDLV